MRQNRGLYLAGGIFVLAAAIYFFADKNGKSPVVSPSPLPSPVIAIGVSQVQQVVVHAHAKVLTIARQGTGWTFSDRAEGQSDCAVSPADQSLTLQFLQTLTELRPTHVIYGAPEGLPAYGVDKPSAGEVDIRSISGQQVTLLVGGKSPDGSSYFLRRQDSQDIQVVATATLDAQVLGLVDKPPVRAPSPAPGALPSAVPSAPVPSSP